MKQNGAVCWPGPALLFLTFRFENLISGPKRYRDFQGTGPWTNNLSVSCLIDTADNTMSSNYFSMVINCDLGTVKLQDKSQPIWNVPTKREGDGQNHLKENIK